MFYHPAPRTLSESFRRNRNFWLVGSRWSNSWFASTTHPSRQLIAVGIITHCLHASQHWKMQTSQFFFDLRARPSSRLHDWPMTNNSCKSEKPNKEQTYTTVENPQRSKWKRKWKDQKWPWGRSSKWKIPLQGPRKGCQAAQRLHSDKSPHVLWCLARQTKKSSTRSRR